MSYHRSHSLGKVPFLWENQPGVCKVTPSTEESPKAGPPQKPLKLPPPPCSTDGRKLLAHGLYVPLPPCPFLPPRRSSSKKGMSRTETDPFLAAYMECTKSVKKEGKATKGKDGFEKIGLAFSSKHPCGVREDGKVRLRFLWENQPRVCKVTPGTEESPNAGPPQKPLKLPLPPCSTDGRKLLAHGLHVPLPPCPFQPTRGILSKKGMSRRDEDPFLAAYMECTKSVNKQKKPSKGKAGFEKVGLGFSCKHACGVREDGMVRLSQLPGFHLKGERMGRGDGRKGISSLKGRD